MSILSVVVVVFAVLGAVGAVLKVLGAVLPATSSVGQWCRTVGGDIKQIFRLKKSVENAVSTLK